jgi:RND family efflux transporter MFP subunit
MPRSIPSKIAVAAVLLAAIVAVFFAVQGPPAEAQAPGGKGAKGGGFPAPKVLVAKVRQDSVSDQKTFVGTVTPKRRSLVGSAAAGRVEEFLVNEGDFIEAGKPIAILRRGVIQAELNAAKGMLGVRQAELKELETSFQDEVAQAQAKLAVAQADLSFRTAKLERSRALGASIARELLEEDNSLAVQAAAAVREAEAALRLLTGGAREQKTEQARAQVEAQAAEVERLSEQFDRHTMYAPFDGFVTAEHTEIGQWVMQGEPIAEIAELNDVDVQIPVLEDHIAWLSPGVPATVSVPALGGEDFQGQVAVVVPQADARARTFPVKIRVPNQTNEQGQPRLKAGMLARVSLSIGAPVETLLIPKDAVVLGGPSPLVYAIASDGGQSIARPVPVTLGMEHGRWIAVQPGGLKKNDQVVVEGNERLRPMQEVRPETKELEYP